MRLYSRLSLVEKVQRANLVSYRSSNLADELMKWLHYYHRHAGIWGNRTWLSTSCLRAMADKEIIFFCNAVESTLEKKRRLGQVSGQEMGIHGDRSLYSTYLVRKWCTFGRSLQTYWAWSQPIDHTLQMQPTLSITEDTKERLVLISGGYIELLGSLIGAHNCIPVGIQSFICDHIWILY